MSFFLRKKTGMEFLSIPESVHPINDHLCVLRLISGKTVYTEENNCKKRCLKCHIQDLNYLC